MHLGPLEGPLKHLERILIALGRLLDRLEAILSALEAILAENVAWTCMDLHGTCIGSAAAAGPSEGRGSIPKGIWLPWSGASVADTEAVFYDSKRRCTPEGTRRIVYASRIPPTQSLQHGAWRFLLERSAF